MVSPKLLAGRSSRIYPDSPCSDSAHYRYRKGFEVQAGEHTPTLFLTLKSRAAIPYFNEECRYGAPAPIRSARRNPCAIEARFRAISSRNWSGGNARCNWLVSIHRASTAAVPFQP